MSDFKHVFDDYLPQDAVSWFSAATLVNTYFEDKKTKKIDDRRVESSAFESRFSDFYQGEEDNEDIWIDYLADTGDGFNETLTVMYKCVGSVVLEDQTLTAGQILLCGGDQVYPFATSRDYANRFFGPFLTAQSLRYGEADKGFMQRYLHAIPGNHDWYGGLYAFQEYFCSKRQYGNYLAKQPMSYHALRLTEKIWIWMLDIQLAENFNAEQITYFSELCTAGENAPKSDEHWQIILCIAQPFWYQKSVDPEDKLFTIVDNFITQLFINQNPKNFTSAGGSDITRFLELKLILTGDIHHYTRFNLRYSDLLNKVDDPKYKDRIPISQPLVMMTAGGGGAYTAPTHHLEDKVNNRAFQSKINNETINMDHYYPAALDSIKLRHHCIWNIVFKNLSFVYFPMMLYLCSFLVFLGYLPPYTNAEKLGELEYIPALVTFFILGTIIFFHELAKTMDKYFSYMPQHHQHAWYGLATLFGLIYLGLFFIGIEAQNWVIHYVGNIEDVYKTTLITIAFIINVFLLSVINTFFFGLYIYLSNVFFKLHDNEVFAISKINKFKNFLRIKIDKKEITIYPLGIKDVNNTLKTSFKHKEYSKLKHDLDQTKVALIEKEIKISLLP